MLRTLKTKLATSKRKKIKKLTSINSKIKLITLAIKRMR